MCQVIFSGKGISSQMAPEEAVKNIKNLVISTTERGSQDHNSLLAAYKVLDRHITKMDIQRPVVLLTDGHSSRFNFEVLQFCREKQIRMFVSPPDTTGVTQLLDQINQKLHLEYKNSKEGLFTAWSTINREGFMMILAQMWSKWASAETIKAAGKRVGISENGVNVGDMQEDKFIQAAGCISLDNSVSSTPSTPNVQSTPCSSQMISSPVSLRKGSALYYKHKFEKSKEIIKKCHQEALRLEDIPGLLTVSKVKPSSNFRSPQCELLKYTDPWRGKI